MVLRDNLAILVPLPLRSRDVGVQLSKIGDLLCPMNFLTAL